MANKLNLKPLSIVLGTAVGVSLANISVAAASENPFSMKPLSAGYMLVADAKDSEGKCGGSKGKDSEGKCGGSKSKDSEGKCGGSKGSGREFRGGMKYMDANGDGKVTHEEFMKGHEAMFKQMDSNNDGVVDPSEHAAFKRQRKEHMKQGKGAEGKCGGAKE